MAIENFNLLNGDPGRHPRLRRVTASGDTAELFLLYWRRVPSQGPVSERQLSSIEEER